MAEMLFHTGCVLLVFPAREHHPYLVLQWFRDIFCIAQNYLDSFWLLWL